jgi:hypothetical protein
MSDQANSTMPPEWKACAAETVRALAVARHLAARHATEEVPEAALLPAMLLSVSILKSAADLGRQIDQAAGKLEMIQLAIDCAVQGGTL